MIHPARPVLGPDPRRLSKRQRRQTVVYLRRSRDAGAQHLADLYEHCQTFYPGWESGLPREGEAPLPARIERPVSLGGASVAAACMEI